MPSQRLTPEQLVACCINEPSFDSVIRGPMTFEGQEEHITNWGGIVRSTDGATCYLNAAVLIKLLIEDEWLWHLEKEGPLLQGKTHYIQVACLAEVVADD